MPTPVSHGLATCRMATGANASLLPAGMQQEQRRGGSEPSAPGVQCGSFPLLGAWV